MRVVVRPQIHPLPQTSIISSSRRRENRVQVFTVPSVGLFVVSENKKPIVSAASASVFLGGLIKIVKITAEWINRQTPPWNKAAPDTGPQRVGVSYDITWSRGR